MTVKGCDYKSKWGLRHSSDKIAVIKYQEVSADNLDIVVVALGDEGTLKRFSKMGNNAILLAENPKYDPILLKDDQVNILGLAVGVIKSGNRN